MTEKKSSRPVALVTGSGRDRIGNRIIRDLAENGFAVVVHYHSSKESAAELVAELLAQGVDATSVQANVSLEHEVDAMFKEIEQTYGRLDLLVTSASIWNPIPLDEVTVNDVMTSYAVNTMGTFLCARAAGRIMRNQDEGGAIVTMGDWAIERPYPNYAAYFMAKGAIPTLTRMMARELAQWNPNIRVNCIHPGPVMLPPDTPEEESQYLLDATLVRRVDCPDEIAKAVRYFVESRFVTGVCLPVDGGRSIFATGENR